MESCRYTSVHVRTVHKHIVKREKFMFDIIKQEIAIIRDRDPAIKSDMEVFLYTGRHINYTLKSIISLHVWFHSVRLEEPV